MTRPLNHMRMFLAPDELCPFVENWPSVASALLIRARHKAMAAPLDHALQLTWRELIELPDVLVPQLAESSSCSDFNSRETRTSVAITASSIECSDWKESGVPQLLGVEPLSAFHAA